MQIETADSHKILLEINPKDIQEVKDLAEWTSLKMNLEHVFITCNNFLLMDTPENKNSHLLEDLYISVLVTYARCFSSGVRGVKLDPNIFAKLPGHPIATHQYYMDIRNKHIAHSINIFEETKVGVKISAEFEITAVVCTHKSRIHDERQGIIQLGLLTKFATQYVDKKISEFTSIVLEKVKQISKEEILKLKPISLSVQGGSEAAKKKRTS